MRWTCEHIGLAPVAYRSHEDAVGCGVQRRRECERRFSAAGYQSGLAVRPAQIYVCPGEVWVARRMIELDSYCLSRGRCTLNNSNVRYVGWSCAWCHARLVWLSRGTHKRGLRLRRAFGLLNLVRLVSVGGPNDWRLRNLAGMFCVRNRLVEFH